MTKLSIQPATFPTLSWSAVTHNRDRKLAGAANSNAAQVGRVGQKAGFKQGPFTTSTRALHAGLPILILLVLIGTLFVTLSVFGPVIVAGLRAACFILH